RAIVPLLDASRLADFIVLALSSVQEVDSLGHLILRSILAQGVSNVISVVANITARQSQKQRADVKKSLISYIKQYTHVETKMYATDIASEAASIMRLLCTQIPDGIRWREQRSYVLAQKIWWDGGIRLEGVVRGKGFNVDRLVNVTGWGDFQ